MYLNHIKYILINLKLFKIDLLLNKTLKYLIIYMGSILAQVPFWDTTMIFIFTINGNYYFKLLSEYIYIYLRLICYTLYSTS